MICNYCGSPFAITKDHIHPRSRGGDNSLKNIQPLCKYCNNKKGRHTEVELVTIFADIEKYGVQYAWEKPFEKWLRWIKIVSKERRHDCPLLHYESKTKKVCSTE